MVVLPFLLSIVCSAVMTDEIYFLELAARNVKTVSIFFVTTIKEQNSNQILI